MPVENREKELSKIYDDIGESKLVLPNFQRGFIWSREKQKKLVSSMLVGLPVGSLLILEGQADDFSKRKLCFPEEVNVNKDCDYLLDGQQRLSSLRTIFFDVFDDQDWKETWDSLYGTLRTRWFVRIRPTDAEEDIFGYENLIAKDLNKFTDNDIEDFVNFLPIHKTKESEVHHPGFKLKNSDGVEETREAFIKDHVTKHYAANFLVPLWETSKGMYGLHRRVLRKIADARVAELKVIAEHKEHSVEFYEGVFKTVGITVDDIKIALSSGDGIEVDRLWQQLATEWVTKLSADLENVSAKKMPIIHLHRDELNRAVAIFEAINRGGVPLSTYDLVVAKSARNQGIKNLSSRIIELVEADIEIIYANFEKYAKDEKTTSSWSAQNMRLIDGNEPTNAFKDWFVNVLSLLVYVRKEGKKCAVDHIKKEKILAISSSDINNYSDQTVNSIIRALAFLQLRCGVITGNEVSYKLMVVVLAFYLSDDQVWNSKQALDRLEYWYWYSLFGGSYFYSQNKVCVDDVERISLLLDGDFKSFSDTDRILNVPDFVTKEILLRKSDVSEKEPSSIRAGILQYVLSKIPADFMLKDDVSEFGYLSAWNISQGDIEVEIHHIIPLASQACIGETAKRLRKLNGHVLNSPLNLAYISKKANRMLGPTSPTEYVELLQSFAGETNCLPSYDKVSKSLHGDDADYVDALDNRYGLLKSSIVHHLHALK